MQSLLSGMCIAMDPAFVPTDKQAEEELAIDRLFYDFNSQRMNCTKNG